MRRRSGTPLDDLQSLMSDYMGAALMFEALPKATAMLGDRGDDADWFRGALTAKGITPRMPPGINRKAPIPHERTLYRQRHKIKNMFGMLKDWRRIHPSAAFPRCFASSEPFGCSARYDRCAHTFMSAIAIAATVIFWAAINES